MAEHSERAEQLAPPGDGEPASARRLATRARLLEAAMAEVAERGFHATSIEHIAERAGFTRGAFYSNFESKEQLFAEALEAGRRELVADLERQLATTALPVDAGVIDRIGIEPVVERVLRGMPKEATWYVLNVEADLLAARDPAFAAATRDSATRLFDDMAALLDATLAEYGLRFSIGSDRVIRVLFGYFSTALREAVLEGRAEEAWPMDAEQARIVARLLVALIEPGSLPAS